LKVELENICKNWGSFALKNINLSIADGDYLVLLGPTGAGKTLLLETIMGFYMPDEGRILIDERDVTDVPPEKREIGYVPQNSLLFPHMTVSQNIAFGLKMQNKDKALRDNTVNGLLDFMSLKQIAHHFPVKLSGGEKQKVALARALATNSKIVLLDEPLASVDAETAKQLRDELKRIRQESYKTVIHVTHSLIEGFGLANKIALMKAGEIVQVGETSELLAKPKNEFAARLLGYENVFKAKLLQKRSDFSVIEVEGLQLKISGSLDSVGLVAVLPEDITIELSFPNGSYSNVLEGSIVNYTDLGPIVMVSIKAGLPLKVVMAKNSFIDKGLENGKIVWVKFNANVIKKIE
jgi:molybdate/tungstate transport system ATP-binding protein